MAAFKYLGLVTDICRSLGSSVIALSKILALICLCHAIRSRR